VPESCPAVRCGAPKRVALHGNDMEPPLQATAPRGGYVGELFTATQNCAGRTCLSSETKFPAWRDAACSRPMPPLPVCQRRATNSSSSPRSLGLYALPTELGITYFTNASCEQHNGELGVDGARLPVLHAKTRRENHPGGFWFYCE
jgi:hypothetical protein